MVRLRDVGEEPFSPTGAVAAHLTWPSRWLQVLLMPSTFVSDEDKDNRARCLRLCPHTLDRLARRGKRPAMIHPNLALVYRRTSSEVYHRLVLQRPSVPPSGSYSAFSCQQQPWSMGMDSAREGCSPQRSRQGERKLLGRYM